MSNSSIIRISKEVSDLQNSSDLSLAAAYLDDDVRNVKALIVGPHETPYEFGFFELSMKFDQGYPENAPNVLSLTTNGGKCRFNPNIYASGRVCLSTLNTWSGDNNEQWTPAQGLESILISIQSLMSSNPYKNEPGYAQCMLESHGENQKEYAAKIRHESLRISIIKRLEEYLSIPQKRNLSLFHSIKQNCRDLRNKSHSYDLHNKGNSNEDFMTFEPFKDFCKRKFMWYYDSYLMAILKAKSEFKDGHKFAQMPFEHQGNEMKGEFCYSDLERRLKVIRKTIDDETKSWAIEGSLLRVNEPVVVTNMQTQFEQTVEACKSERDVIVDIELVEFNPLVWSLTYFGMPMTNLDGGIFKIKLCFSPRFPEEQPRVKLENELFHHRVTSDGTLCYTPKLAGDVLSHVKAIIDALKDESPPYDPRTLVNPEVGKLFWGSEDDRKTYARKLRRSVQKTLE